MRTISSLITFALIFLFTTLSWAETCVLRGSQEAIYQITNQKGVVTPPNYSTLTYSQEIIMHTPYQMKVKITTNLIPLNTQIPFPLNSTILPEEVKVYLRSTQRIEAEDRRIKDLSLELTQKTEFLDQAVVSILSWVSDNIIYDETLRLPTDALSVLKNRSAKCEGYSNLSVALLRSRGIPSRAVTNYIPPGHRWGIPSLPQDGGMHSSLEVFYPDIGWITYDAQGSYHFVDPYHFYLFSEIDDEGSYFEFKGSSKENMRLVKGNAEYKRRGDFFRDPLTKVITLSEVDTTYQIDQLPSPEEKIFASQIRQEQKGGTIFGEVTNSQGKALSTDKTKAWVFLWQENKGKGYYVKANGFYSITGLKTNSYTIDAQAELFAKSEKVTLFVKRGEVVRQDFCLFRGGTIKGKVTYSDGEPAKNCWITATLKEDSSFIPYEIDENGYYLLPDLPSADYFVQIISKETHYVLLTEKVTVKRGEVIELNITLAR